MEPEIIKFVPNDVLTEVLPIVQPIDIEFENVSYTIHSTGKPKRLLNGISGNFRSGAVTAVLGPSGAGKTTLLNVLAGYAAGYDAGGIVRVNGKPRNPSKFRHKCAYIMQDSLLQQHLTTAEAIDFASRLKVADMTDEIRQRNIQEILETLGIDTCAETMCDVLSGGQRKRLTIALELVSNPSVIFLDEPTTGLDIYAGKMVMNALTRLAEQGRTIVCTVHQPSPLEFQAYDQVFVVAKGCCVYSGSPRQVVPFLQDAGVPCPPTYSPADYIIELIQINPEIIDSLSRKVAAEQAETKFSVKNIKRPSEDVARMIKLKSHIDTPTAKTKLRILISRMMLQHWRNREQMGYQLLHHLISALLVGATFYNTGENAEEFVRSMKLGMSISVFFVYTYAMVAILHFPLELELVKREHFNNWYGTLTYNVAFSLSNIPFMLPNIILFAVISYMMSAIPMELNRFSYFTLLSFLSAFAAEGLGIFIGSLGNVKNGCVLGPAVVGPLFALAIYGIGYGTAIEPIMAVLMNFAFMRYILVGYWHTIFGMNREPFPCHEIYCHWTHSETTLRDIGVDNMEPWYAITLLVIFTLFHRFISYISIRHKLRANMPGSQPHLAIVGVANKVINHFRRSSVL